MPVETLTGEKQTEEASYIEHVFGSDRTPPHLVGHEILNALSALDHRPAEENLAVQEADEREL